MADNSKITKKQLNAAMTKVKEYADGLGGTGGEVATTNKLVYIPGIFSQYASNIQSRQLRDEVSGTTYHLTYIPNKDIDGELIKMFNGYAGSAFNDGSSVTTSAFA